MIKLILLSSIILLSSPSQGLLMSGVYGKNADAHFIRNFYQRILRSDENKTLLMLSSLTADDKYLISLWQKEVKSWGYQPEDHHIFETFYFSYTYTQGKLTSSKLFIGLENWPENLLPAVQRVFKNHHLGLDTNLLPYFFGLEWSLDSSQANIYLLFKTRALFEKAFPNLLETSKKHPLDLWHEAVSLKLTEKGPEATFLSKTIPRHELPTKCPPDLFSVKKRVSSDGVHWQLNLRSLFTQMLSPQAQPLIEKFRKEFYLTPDNMVFKDPDNFTLVYP